MQEKYDMKRYLAFQYKKWGKYAKELNHNKVDNYIIKSWIEEHIAEKYQKEYLNHLDKINDICKNKCNLNCKGLERCVLDCEEIENILDNH